MKGTKKERRVSERGRLDLSSRSSRQWEVRRKPLPRCGGSQGVGMNTLTETISPTQGNKESEKGHKATQKAG